MSIKNRLQELLANVLILALCIIAFLIGKEGVAFITACIFWVINFAVLDSANSLTETQSDYIKLLERVARKAGIDL